MGSGSRKPHEYACSVRAMGRFWHVFHPRVAATPPGDPFAAHSIPGRKEVGHVQATRIAELCRVHCRCRTADDPGRHGQGAGPVRYPRCEGYGESRIAATKRSRDHPAAGEGASGRTAGYVAAAWRAHRQGIRPGRGGVVPGLPVGRSHPFLRRPAGSAAHADHRHPLGGGERTGAVGSGREPHLRWPAAVVLLPRRLSGLQTGRQAFVEGRTPRVFVTPCACRAGPRAAPANAGCRRRRRRDRRPGPARSATRPPPGRPCSASRRGPLPAAARRRRG